MKICIITFSDFNTNYGSILQAFALKCFLEKNGHNVTFIRYREFNETTNKSFKFAIKALIIKAYKYIYRKRQEQRYTNFQRFIERYLNHTRLYSCEEDLKNNLPEFDAYICGSDQIWNIPVLGGLREPYFLKFAAKGKLKIAYAPSMGEYEPENKIKEQILQLLNDFDAISSREEKTSVLLSKMLGHKVSTVLDPTFLLSREDWLKSFPRKHIPKGEYAVCYFVRRNKLANKMVKIIKRKFGIPIYNLSDNLINVPETNNDYVTCPPDVFVNMVANAKFCVGTSFHLAAFSTIFGKHCFIAGSQHNKERILNIFKLINRENHLIFQEHLNNLSCFTISDDDELDYRLLNNKVAYSKNFLTLALTNNGKR